MKEYKVKEMLNQSQEDKLVEQEKQDKLAAQQAAEQAEQGGGVPDPKGKGSGWRDKARPRQKTIHFDDALHMKINILKQLEKKPIEDILYDIVSEWFDEHFEEKKKELLGQL